MYPTGHFSFAIAFRKKQKGWLFLLFCCFLTILPDFDLVFGVLHRGLTHSILFSIIIGFIISIKNWYYYSSMVLSHSIFDMLCKDHPRNGVMLLWQFSHKFYQFSFTPFEAIPLLDSLKLEFIFGLIFILTVRTIINFIKFLMKLENKVEDFKKELSE